MTRHPAPGEEHFFDLFEMAPPCHDLSTMSTALSTTTATWAQPTAGTRGTLRFAPALPLLLAALPVELAAWAHSTNGEP
jgi:hypothetical protein